MKKKRIMVVEDEGVTALSIQSSLKDMGYTVISNIFSGEEAIQRSAKDKPDLVLMDIILAGKIDGIETASLIQGIHDIPVVYLTAHSDAGMLKRIKSTDPFGYILKPFDNHELRMSVEIALYKHDMQKQLKRSNDELEANVKARTEELEKTILLLREAEKKLIIDAGQLEESNTALKVLLKQREHDRKELENRIMSNVKHLVLPYIEKLKKNRPVSEELDYITLLESNLNNIISPFSEKLSFQYLDFTPREMMVADLIREGKQDKDIMNILHISLDTVKAHRKNIRKKLGINNKKINLRSKLLSLAK